jgi:lipopolysaccharide transport system permease protein
MVEDRLGPNYRFLLDLNPVTGIIEAFRVTLIPERSIDWEALGISMFLTLIVFALGAIYFHKSERRFADVI